jgi:hypothetical protein
MNLVTVTDSKTKTEYQYDADMKIATADDGLAFYTSQLSFVEAKIYETKYRKIVFQDFIPVDTSLPEYVDEFTYYSYDSVTSGKFIGANGKDLPESDISASKSTAALYYGGNSYSYSLDELRKSQMLRMPVDTLKAQASYRGFQEHAQRVAFSGDADRNLEGVFNNSNVQSDNSVVDWSTATGQEIVEDMNSLLIEVWQNSAEVHLADTFALPSDSFAQISSQRMDSGTDTTILQFFKENNLFKNITGQELDVKPNFELKTAGVASAPRMMAYEKTEENLTMKMSIVWRSLAPQPDGLRVKVPCEYKFGGVEFRYPGSAAYRDFI